MSANDAQSEQTWETSFHCCWGDTIPWLNEDGATGTYTWCRVCKNEWVSMYIGASTVKLMSDYIAKRNIDSA
jgi:hypothetical protein